jgi:NAD(P)-dependent dehydrogenase (short-subunit alcohol dehydrogenase family)
MMMHDRPVTLITGANQGIGLQVAKDLARHGFTVLIGSRDLARGEEAVGTVDGDARAIQLDVTDHASVAAAAARIRDELGRLDVLGSPERGHLEHEQKTRSNFPGICTDRHREHPEPR